MTQLGLGGSPGLIDGLKIDGKVSNLRSTAGRIAIGSDSFGAEVSV